MTSAALSWEHLRGKNNSLTTFKAAQFWQPFRFLTGPAGTSQHSQPAVLSFPASIFIYE